MCDFIYFKRMGRRISLFAIFYLVAILCGCGSSTAPISTPLVRPGVGSLFFIHTYDLDSNGAKRLGVEWFDTVTVLATGMSFQGRNNVSGFRWLNDDSDIGHVSYDANGDWSLFKESDDRNRWITFQLSEKGSSSHQYDTTYLIANTPYHDRGSDTCSYIGEGVSVINGQSISVSKFRVVDRYLNAADDYTEEDWIAPQLGFWVSSRGEKLMEVTGYVLK